MRGWRRTGYPAVTESAGGAPVWRTLAERQQPLELHTKMQSSKHQSHLSAPTRRQPLEEIDKRQAMAAAVLVRQIFCSRIWM